MTQPAFDFVDEPIDDTSDPTFTVGELANAINESLRRGFADGVWVRGEIDGLRNSGPHTYFSLVEQVERGKAVLNVSLFAPMKRNITPILKKNRLELANGMNVRLFGHLDYYAPNGRLGLKMSQIDPRFTLGEMSQARDQVIRRLIASGMFDANRRLPLTEVPLRVGVVASVGTAAWHDFRDEIDRSSIGFSLVVCDTRVQGEGADRSVSAAISTLSARGGLDCIVLIRGGGARNELATFDSEAIAITIANSSVPVITGIGHEIDRSIADEVAHTAVKTPTACAGFLVHSVQQYGAAVETSWSAIADHAERGLITSSALLSDRAHRIAHRTHAAVASADERLSMRVERLRQRASRALDSQTTMIEHAEARVSLLDPVNLLRRGWSITRDSDGQVVRSAADIAVGSQITTQIADGTLTSRIEEP